MMTRVRESAHPRKAGGGPQAEVTVNRAPVLTLWAAVVARRLGFDRDEALTMGRVVAGLNAYSKGVSLGIFKPTPEAVSRERKRVSPGALWHVELLHRSVPVVQTEQGLRAVSKDKPVSPESVERYLESKFGAALGAVEKAMDTLALSLPADQLAGRAYALYEAFRPQIPAGVRGWGAAGVLDIGRILELAG
jgi:hypothetical protein